MASLRAGAAILLLAGGALAGVVAAAVGAEIYLRTTPWDVCMSFGPGEQRNAIPGPSWARSHPELGWVSIGERYGINAQGFRDPHDFDAIVQAPGRKRLMVLGDSFMWGAGIDVDETVPALLEDALGSSWNVFNVSVPAWGIDQMYLAYLHFHETIKPDVVLLAFIDEDVDRVLEAYRGHEGMNKPSFELRDGELVPRTRTPPRRGVAKLLYRSAAARCSTRAIRRATTARAITAAIFRELAAHAARRKEAFLIARIPSREAVDSPVGALLWRLRSFGATLEGTPARYVELLHAFEQSGLSTAELYKTDGHLRAAGAEVVAASILPSLSSEGAGAIAASPPSAAH